MSKTTIHPSESFICDMCHIEKEELNQREDISIGVNLSVQPGITRCAFICNECLGDI